MDKSQFDHKRKSYIQIGKIYFWTATINKWQQLLQKDIYKNVLICSLEHLSNAGKVDVFAFVIMPNPYGRSVSLRPLHTTHPLPNNLPKKLPKSMNLPPV